MLTFNGARGSYR